MRIKPVSPVQPITQGYYRKAEQAVNQVVDLDTYRETKQNVQNYDIGEPTTLTEKLEILGYVLIGLSVTYIVIHIVVALFRWLLR